MQLASLMNEIVPIGRDDLVLRLSGRHDSDRLGASVSDGLATGAVVPWFSTPSFTAHVYGTLLPNARARLGGAALSAAELVRGVLLHFAVREADVGTVVLMVGEPRASDFAFLDFPKGSATFSFCPFPALKDRSALLAVAPSGNLFFDTEISGLARLLQKGTVSTLFFDMADNADDHLGVLSDLSELLMPDGTLIATGPGERLHMLYFTLEKLGAAKLWAQTVVAGPATSDVTCLANFGVLDRTRLVRVVPVRAPLRPTTVAVEPPRDASPGPYRFVPNVEIADHASSNVVFAPERTVAVRQPLFIDLPHDNATLWTQQFGVTPDVWLRPADIACPALAVPVLDKVRLVGTEVLITADDCLFPESQFPMQPENLLAWAPVFHSDLALTPEGFRSARGSQIGQRVTEPTVLLTNAGMPMHYHFLFDVLPRLWFLKNPDWNNHTITLTTAIRPYQLAALVENYGIDKHRIRLVEPSGPACLFEQAVAAPSMVSDFWFMPEAVIAPRAALSQAVTPRDPRFAGAKRLYVSRRDVADNRSLVNETELVEALLPLGFTEVFPSTFSYEEEMGLFQQAEIIVGPFGSGMSNLMFCSPGAKVVFLQPDSTNWRILSFAMEPLQLDYGYIFGEAFRRHSRMHNTEWVIDVDAVVKRLRGLI